MNWTHVSTAVLAAALGLAGANSAQAATAAPDVSVSATGAADNHFGLYHGAADGTGLTFVGRNTVGGDSGTPANWQVPASFTFTAPSTDRLYVVAWNDGGPQMFIGQFGSANGPTVVTNQTDWQWTAGSGPNPGPNGDVPSIATLTSDVQNANWKSVVSEPNGSAPWGTSSSVSNSASYIWGNTLNLDASVTSGPGIDNYIIFRSVPEIGGSSSGTGGSTGGATAVPVPAALWATLPVIGLMVFYGSARKKLAVCRVK